MIQLYTLALILTGAFSLLPGRVFYRVFYRVFLVLSAFVKSS